MVGTDQNLLLGFKEFTFTWWSKCKIHIEINLDTVV